MQSSTRDGAITPEAGLVSAVIVNWNGAEHLKTALPSLKQQSYSPLEILVVDNGSTDGSRAIIHDTGVTLVPLPTNRGLSFALNEGARRAHGAFLLFLNNDMRFPPDLVEQVVAPLFRDPSLFATDARQLDWEGNRQIHLATKLVRRSLIASYLRPGLTPLLDIAQYPSAEPVAAFQACSAAMAVRRDLFESLGGFDERLIVSWEDTDLCWRAWLRGWRTIYVPAASCYHRIGGATTSQVGALTRIRGIVGGRLIFATKHLPLLYALNAWFVTGCGFARDIIMGRFSEAGVKSRTIGSAIVSLPTLLAERRRLYQSAGLSPSTQLRRMLKGPRTVT